MKKETVKSFVDALQSRGCYSFAKTEIESSLNITGNAVKKALNRLEAKRRIARIRRGFYTVIPMEYQESGILPPSWFIDQLMNYSSRYYYVGLLSAASFEGASHQQPQQFQVVTDKQVRPVTIHGLSIHFYVKKNFPPYSELKKVKTRTGYIWVSEPELTALDLILYTAHVGGMNHAATVLVELGEKIRMKKLTDIAKKEKSLILFQRLGYILDLIGYEKKTTALADWIKKEKPDTGLLDPALPKDAKSFSEKWHLYINREIVPDDL